MLRMTVKQFMQCSTVKGEKTAGQLLWGSKCALLNISQMWDIISGWIWKTRICCTYPDLESWNGFWSFVKDAREPHFQSQPIFMHFSRKNTLQKEGWLSICCLKIIHCMYLFTVDVALLHKTDTHVGELGNLW